MAYGKKSKAKNKGNGGNLGFKKKLWQAADKMRGHMDPAEYKHVVLGLIFLKYISDAFEERRSWLSKETAKLEEQFAEGARLERAIRKNLKGLGYEI